MTQEAVEVAMPSYSVMILIYYIASIIYLRYVINNDERYAFEKEDLEDYIHYYAILLAAPTFTLAILIIKMIKALQIKKDREL